MNMTAEALETRLEAMQRDSQDAERQRRQAAQAERRKKWTRVQRDYPNHAQFLTDIAKTFGRPAKVTMIDEDTGERIL